KVERGLTSTLLLAIHGLGKVSQPLVDPGPRRWHRGVNQFVNQIDAGKLRILGGQRSHQQSTTLEWSRIRIGKIGDGHRRVRRPKPFAYELRRWFERVGIGGRSDLVPRETEQIQRRL